MFQAEDRIAELVALCRHSGIEEVMLFLLGEELSTGHPTQKELRPWVEMAQRLKAELGKNGIALSLNPWSTLYHLARGRQLKEGQAFTRMVGETGETEPVVACPLCPVFQNHLCEVWAYLARELRPLVLWVEDDWRLHNHGSELGYGGCFCDRHLAAFAKRIGQTVARTELLNNLLAPGRPHPWRKTWLDLCRESLLEPARKLRQAVQQASPETRLALMSSNPDDHCIEGRDWPALQEALGRTPAFLVRPHMPPYTEASPIVCAPVVTRHTLANLEGPLEVYPELESSPRCGRYSKSAAYSLWECFASACIGAAGIALNHFDMMGNGTALDPGFGQALRGGKTCLNALAALGLDDRQAQGVQVLFSPRVAEHMHVEGARSLNDLDARSTVWGQTLSILGIAHGFAPVVRHAKGTPYAVSGQTLRAISSGDIERLLSGPVLLDAVSVEILLDRGLGDLLGVPSAEWVMQEDAAYAFESIHEPDASVYGLTHPRMTASRCARRILAMKPADKNDVLSTICQADRRPLFPGCVLHANGQGGRVLSLAYPLDGRHQFFMGFFNAFRRIFIQRMLFEMAPDAPLAAVEDWPMHLYRTATEKGELLAAFNVLYDRQECVALRLPRDTLQAGEFSILRSDGQWRPCDARIQRLGQTQRVEIDVDLPPLGEVFLLRGDRNGASAPR
jgi:hypothetical protein